MKNRRKRLTSLLLTLVMVLGMLPATTLTANALMYTGVDTWEELVEELTTGDAGYIMLEEDITAEILIYDWFGQEQADYFRYEVEGDYNDPLYPYVPEPYCTVTGNKTLDLNGYSIKIKLWEPDIDWVNPWETTMFYIPKDAALTVNDSGQDGSIEYTGCFAGEVGDLGDFSNYDGYLHTDVFQTSGKLIVNGGKIEAGNTRKEWLNAAYKDLYYKEGDVPLHGWLNTANGEWFDSKYARQMVWGTAVNVESGGTLVVNGGTLIGRGQGEFVTFDPDSDWNSNDRFSWRDSVIEYATNSTVIVNGGSVKALGGANAFEGNGDLTVRAGFFQTDKHDYVRCLDSYAPPHFNVMLDTCETVISGSYGDMGIPDSAWKDEAARMQVLVDNAVYNGNAAGKVELNKTGGQTSGESLQVTIVPWLSDNKLPVTLNGGPYTNETVHYDGREFNWNTKSDNLVATVDYEPYFADTTGLKNAAPVYTWHLWGHYGTNGEVSKDIVTTTGRLDISAAWEEAAGTGNFRQMKVSCVVSEAPTNCAYRMETKTNEFRLKPTKTPLDESSLPGGKMEVKISYPEYSGLGSYIVVTVKPSAEELAKAENGSCTVRYEYLYRDNMAEWEDEPHAWPYNTYSIPDADWGHVKVDVKMIVFGTNGAGYAFEKSAWALKLPDITVSGASLNSDKTAYVGSPGNAVTLKAPIDSKNAQVAADKIVASDIAGWYKITYNSNGDPVYSYIGGNQSTSVTVSNNGVYCYAGWDRDNNLVYSKPITVQFSAEAYSISIKRYNDYIFTVYDSTGGIVEDISISATIGSAVTKSNVYWKIQSAPVGVDISDISTVRTLGKTDIKFSDFFPFTSDKQNIVPGNYVIVAYVKKDGSVLATSNSVTVQVARVANFMDITDEAGNVISDKTIEGAYAGDTMKLNCVPGNGASAPSVYTVDWKVESLVGTNVATIDANGVLTLNKPGQIKVTATVTTGAGQFTLTENTQTVIINIPITEVEVTLGTPTVGGDPDAIASVPADAPYELVYNQNYWNSGVHPDTGKFYGSLVPELRVEIVPKDGYVFPARQLYLEDYDKSWYTYADDIVVKVNGTSYSFSEFAETYVDGYTEYRKDYDGTFYEAQAISFIWTWDRLRDPSHTYVNYVNLTIENPMVGEARNNDLPVWYPVCTNSEAIYPYGSGLYKVSGDYLNDTDASNDNAVKMENGETFQMGQIYRMGIYFTTNNNGHRTTYFDKDVILMINGKRFTIMTLGGGTDLEGSQTAKAYYYFMPTAPIQTIDMLWIDDLEAPVGYKKPATADDITEFSSNFIVGDEVYVTRLTWFYDVNNNGAIDTGEDSGDSFNADGSFLAGLRYSVYLELEARDRDDDGKGDFVKFADNAKIYLSSQSNAQMTGNQNGAVYKFPAAAMPAKAVTTDPGQVTIELEEGYNFATKPVKTVNVTSVGTTEITSIVVEAEDSTLLLVAPNGMSFEVAPQADLAKGTYRTNVVIKDTEGNVLTTVPVTITVTGELPLTLTGSTTGGIKVTVENLKGSATLIVAQYEGGKMVDVEMQTVSADNTYSFTGLTHKTGCTYKAFLVNSTTYAPLCAADDF